MADIIKPKPTIFLKRLLPRLPDRTFAVLQKEDGYPICVTVERPWLNNQHDISCYPPGEYQLKRKFSEEFKYEVFAILNVPNRDGCELHKGNFFEDSKGCTILGEEFAFVQNKQGQMEFGVGISGQAFDYFMNTVMKGVDEATLVVTEV